MEKLVKQIEIVVCKGESVNINDLYKRTDNGKLCKEKEIATCRQYVMYFLKEYEPVRTWANIAGIYGLDHATAMHAHKTVLSRMDIYRDEKEKVSGYKLKIDELILFQSNLKIDRITGIREVISISLNSEIPIDIKLIELYNQLVNKKEVNNQVNLE